MGTGSTSERSLVAAVDIGGTFTDCVLVDEDGGVSYGKSLSSPADDFQSGFFGSLSAAAEQGGYTGDELFANLTRLVSHGSTVATNIVVEERGATVGLLTTKGHEDTLPMMRGLGRVTGEPPENILRVTETSKPSPIVPRDRIRGIVERVDSAGSVIVELNDEQLEASISELLELGCDAFAICFLWSIQNPAHEQRAKEVVQRLAPDAFVSVSHELSTAVGEYERTVAAVINAFVGPKTTQYLATLEGRLAELGYRRRTDADAVPRRDGAAGGRQGPPGAQHRLGARRRHRRHPATRRRPRADRRDRHRHGRDQLRRRHHQGPAARGRRARPCSASTPTGCRPSRCSRSAPAVARSRGSIRSRGTLRVGPQSASSNPGPACYDRGGTEPTVTDANLVLGYLDPDAVFGAGERQIRPAPGSRRACDREAVGDARPVGDRHGARHHRDRQREDGQRPGASRRRPRLRPARLRDPLLRRLGATARRRLRLRARRRTGRDPRRGRVGVVRARDRAVGHPLPARARLSADLAVRSGSARASLSSSSSPSCELRSRPAGSRKARR